MNRICLFLMLLAAGPCFGQRGDLFGYREYNLAPPYGANRIQRLVADSTSHSGYSHVLPARIYASLTLREQFTYNMAYPESFTQNCSMEMDPPDAEKLLFAQLPRPFSYGMATWSNRQYDWFKANRDTAIVLIQDCASTGDHLGLNVKLVIVEVNATTLIPFLINTYRMHRNDHDILTVLMLLMIQNQYRPFLATTLYATLYKGKESSYRTSVPFTHAGQDLIIQRATDFYNGLSK